MRWIIKPKPYKTQPSNGDTRVVERFLWWPKILPNERSGQLVRKWLERAKILQKYYVYACSLGGWVSYWEDEYWEDM